VKCFKLNFVQSIPKPLIFSGFGMPVCLLVIEILSEALLERRRIVEKMARLAVAYKTKVVVGTAGLSQITQIAFAILRHLSNLRFEPAFSRLVTN
jgi:hypothetical protein